MIGIFLAVILIVCLILYVLKTIFNDTDFQTWLNILIITVILFTVILSIYMILNRVNNNQSQKIQTPKSKIEMTPEEIENQELYMQIAKKYLTFKADYEKEHENEDGTPYAANQMMDDLNINEQDWQQLYNELLQGNYLDKAAQELNSETDYLIKTK